MDWNRIINVGRVVVETGAQLIGAAIAKDARRVEQILGAKASTLKTTETADETARRLFAEAAARLDQGDRTP